LRLFVKKYFVEKKRKEKKRKEKGFYPTEYQLVSKMGWGHQYLFR